MTTASTEAGTPATRRYLPVIVVLSCLYGGLSVYLFTPALPAGDGAAYLDQASGGLLGQRTVHLGYLLQLLPLARSLGDAGGALLSCLWAAIGLGAALVAGRELTGSWWLAAAAPAALLGMPPFWTHALFPEVYGPAAAAVLVAAALRLRGHAVAAGIAVGVGAAMHPGALIWVPTLAWLGDRRGRFLLAAAVLPLAAALVAPADYWLGERGVLAVLQLPRPWSAAQRLYRLALDAAPLSAALMLLGLADGCARRRLALPLLPGLALVLLTDWRDDVPAALPGLYLAALLVPVGLDQLRERLPRRAVVTAAVVALLACQIGEATSRHDRDRRRTVREVAILEALAARGPGLQPWGSYGERARYRHYVGDRDGGPHVALPPGHPFPAGRCEAQQTLEVAGTALFVCPGEPR